MAATKRIIPLTEETSDLRSDLEEIGMNYNVEKAHWWTYRQKVAVQARRILMRYFGNADLIEREYIV